MKLTLFRALFATFFVLIGLSLQSAVLLEPNKLGDGCAQIVLRNGDVISADIVQITENTIVYKPCGDKTATPVRIEKKTILKVKAPNGDSIFDGGTVTANGVVGRSTNGMAVAGFVCSLVLGPLLGLIFSGIGLAQIRKNPEKYSGEGFAIAGIAISIGYVLLLFLLLAR
jgi:Domain of unknown function (DUF4190)